MTQNPEILTFRPSPFDMEATLIERANYDHTTTPLFSVASKRGSKDAAVHRIGAGHQPIQPTLVGTSKYSSMSASSSVTLHNQAPFKMSTSSMADGYKFAWPAAGKLKWKTKSNGSLLLRDDNRRELARYNASAGFAGASAAKFEILVPVDDYMLDMIVVTGLAAVKMLGKDKKAIEAVGEIIGAVAGG